MPKPETLRNKDLRQYSILPIRAVQDPNINRTAALAVLAVICSYTDELGRTFVSQARIAKDLGISRQAANRQVRKLFELGYLVHAKKQYKGQSTNTIKVIYDKQVKTEKAARSALSAREQMELAEREAGLHEAVHKPVDNSVDNFLKDCEQMQQVQPQMLHEGATSSVDRGATSEVAQNESLTSKNNVSKGNVRIMLGMFSRAGDTMGQARTVSDRDWQVMEAWVRNGLDQETWQQILDNHVSWCKRERRDMARGIGYFAEPVKRILSKSQDRQLNKLLKQVASNLRMDGPRRR